MPVSARRVPSSPKNGNGPEPLTDVLPFWNAELRTLYLGDLVVKVFRQPAPAQEMILSAFQEDGWPPHVDDPLPPVLGLNPKERLHQAIRNLNRAMTSPVIRFHGNGRGSGVFWSLVRPANGFPSLTGDARANPERRWRRPFRFMSMCNRLIQGP